MVRQLRWGDTDGQCVAGYSEDSLDVITASTAEVQKQQQSPERQLQHRKQQWQLQQQQQTPESKISLKPLIQPGSASTKAPTTSSPLECMSPSHGEDMTSTTEPRVLFQDESSGQYEGCIGEQAVDQQDHQGPHRSNVVRLRGLPYEAGEAELMEWLDDLAGEVAQIFIIVNRDGRASGFARISFLTEHSASECARRMHLRAMGDRYVEVFHNTEKKKGPIAAKKAFATPAEDSTPLDGAKLAVILDSCREIMSTPKHRTMLLSTLGELLSADARQYVKKKRGLKAILCLYPDEFVLGGRAGKETATYTKISLSLELPCEPHLLAHEYQPPLLSCEDMHVPLPVPPLSVDDSCAQSCNDGWTFGMLAASDGAPFTPTPRGMRRKTAAISVATQTSPERDSGIRTPSDWGTPAEAAEEERNALSSKLAQLQAAAPSPEEPQGLPLWPVRFSQTEFDSQGLPAMNAWDATFGFPAQHMQQHHQPQHPQQQQFPQPPPQPAPQPQQQPQPPQQHGQVSDDSEDDQEDQNRRQENGTAVVVVRGILLKWTRQDVFQAFDLCGLAHLIPSGRRSVRILRLSSGLSAGIAEVIVRSVPDAAFVQLMLNGRWVNDCLLQVEMSPSIGNEQAWQLPAAQPCGTWIPSGSCGAQSQQFPNPNTITWMQVVQPIPSSSPNSSWDDLFSFLQQDEVVAAPAPDAGA